MANCADVWNPQSKHATVRSVVFVKIILAITIAALDFADGFLNLPFFF
jgi:hypothetical protein